MSKSSVELKYSITKFSKALNRFSSALEEKESDIKLDACIQRFEFTFELAWKTLKRALYYEGEICRTPKDCLKQSFRIGFIGDEENWLTMLDDRNSMSHIYSEEEATKIYNHFPDYERDFKQLQSNLNNRYSAELNSTTD